MTSALPPIPIPAHLLPADGRFGSGPSKVRQAQADAVARAGSSLLGTSHRQDPVRDLVGSVRSRLTDLFTLPDSWEILLGNGGTTVLWDAASFGLIERRSQHLSFGEFSSKFAAVTAAAPHLDDPSVISADPGSAPDGGLADPDIDAYCLTHNETSTGVAVSLARPDGATSDQLVLVDATSAAGGIPWDPAEVDVYYFAPQKCFAGDGGLWLAACSPEAVDRIGRLCQRGDRWIPASIDLGIALDNSLKNQTYNTPALATLILLDEQLGWMLDGGGLEFASGRSRQSAEILYRWAEKSPIATPFVTEPALRSPLVGTIDLDDSIDAIAVSGVLRANGVVDTESYRKLGRNQLRIAMYPAVDPADIEALTACIDHVVGQIS